MRTLLAILFIYSLRFHPTATTYYVKVGGGTGSGLDDANAWSLAKANTMIGGLSGGDQVLLKRGDVFDGALSAPANGSSASARIFIGAYGSGAKPTLNGFQTLSSWSNLGSNIWEASVNSGLNLNLVLLNSVAVTQGRTPNTGSYFRVRSGSVSYPTGFIKGFASDINASTKNWTGADVVLRSSEYTRDINRVTSCTDSTINFNSQSIHDSPAGTGYFFQHDESTLNAQNEWFYNSTAHTIRMYSTSNPSSIGTGVKAAVYDKFVEKDFQSYVEYNNLQFQGYDSIAIKYWQGTGIKVIDCDFAQIGAEGILFDTGTRDSIVNCTFKNIYNTAIYLTYSTYPTVLNNTIDSCGLVIGMGQGNNQQGDGILCVNTADSAVIKDNNIKNVGYVGIYFDGNNSVVRRNYITNFCLTLADGGGINTCCNNLGNTPTIGLRHVDSNTVINGYGYHDDWITVYLGGVMGLYYDDNAGRVSSMRNTLINCSRAGIFLHNTTDSMIVSDNTIYQANGAQAMIMADDGAGGALRKTIVTFNKFYVQSSVYAIQIESQDNDYGSMGTFANNWYSRSATGQLFASLGYTGADYSLSSWKSTFSWDDHSYMTQVVDDSVRMEYNGAASDKYVYLANTYADLEGNAYCGYVRIAPFSSLLLYRKTFPTFRSLRPPKISH